MQLWYDKATGNSATFLPCYLNFTKWSQAAEKSQYSLQAAIPIFLLLCKIYDVSSFETQNSKNSMRVPLVYQCPRKASQNNIKKYCNISLQSVHEPHDCLIALRQVRINSH